MHSGLIRRLAVICKDCYTIRTIDDLFIYAGADPRWRLEPLEHQGSQRMNHFYSWVDGVQHNAPEKFDAILLKVANEIALNKYVMDSEREAVKRALAGVPTVVVPQGFELEALLATLARVLKEQGLNRELAVLTYADARIEVREQDRFDDAQPYALILSIPWQLYTQIQVDIDDCQNAILERAMPLLRSVRDEYVSQVMIVSKLVTDNTWRKKALAWITGEKVNNQGRVRSDNVAPRTCDGLQFRSQQEINLYKALKALGVSFAPLPVFVRGGQEYRRIEPDFVIVKDGIMLVVEVDGDTFHKESPAEAYRTTMLEGERARMIHVNASECETPEKAAAYAKTVLQVIAKYKHART